MSAILYTRLRPVQHEVRFIRLHPPQEGTIQCELFSASLDNHPSYEALSYVWGHSKSNYSIQINGCTVPIADNLSHALYRLQPLVGTKPLWIDQLCINQSDDEERGQQVELMGRIYSGSLRTLLWLGEEACI